MDAQFHIADYVVFILSLVISLAIGVFFSLTGGRQRTNKEYLLGDRNMNFLAVALSLLASNVSAITVMGHPAEIYLYGTQFSFYWLGAILAGGICAFTWVPLLYPLKLTSVNEYLLMRFDSPLVMYFGCFCIVIGSIIYTGICLYGPSTAVELVTGFPTWASIVVSGGVATIYTTVGGIKAVVWTDVFQTFVLVAGVIAYVIQGCISVGGGDEVWKLSGEGGRLIFAEVDPDPRTRMTLWGAVFGTLMPWTTILGTTQTTMQRFGSVGNLRNAKNSVLATLPVMLFIGPLSCFGGLVIYAYYHYHHCDPVRSKQIANVNQILPYFVMEQLNYPGLPGLFIAATYSASLSSASSVINSAAANMWTDIFKDRLPNISELNAAKFTKALGFITGILTILTAIGLIYMKGTIAQISASVSLATLMPIFVMFTMGAACPFYNKWGALTSGLAAGIIPLWLNMAQYSQPSHDNTLPTLIDGCNVFNVSTPNVSLHTSYNYIHMYTPLSSPLNETAYTAILPQKGFLEELYSISHMWINPLGGVVGILIGIVVSLATGRVSPPVEDPKLLFGITRRCCCVSSGHYNVKGNTNAYKYNKAQQDIPMGEEDAIRDKNGVLIQRTEI